MAPVLAPGIVDHVSYFLDRLTAQYASVCSSSFCSATSKLVAANFALIGLSVVAYYIFQVVRLLLSVFVFPGKSVSHWRSPLLTQLSKFGKPGSWAVVTGASDGIGKEFATQLAARKFNILLVSRTASKLEALAAELGSKYGVETKTLAMDFARNDDKDFIKLGQLARELDVAILINNVGQSHSIPVPFLETPAKELHDIVTINCFGTLKVTQMIAPLLVKRRRGLILTMASFGGVLPTPLLATYSGSKAFLQHWSTALASELRPSGVTVQLVQSYLVTSAMSKVRRPSLLIPAPKPFVKATLAKIGRNGGAQGVSATSTPWWSHALMYWFVSIAGPMSALVVDINKGLHQGIRKRALRKAEKEGKKTS